MQQYKILERGFESYTGHIGPIEFVDGVTVSEVDELALMRISGAMRVVNVETEEQVGLTSKLLAGKDDRAEVRAPLPREIAQAKTEDRPVAEAKSEEPTKVEEPAKVEESAKEEKTEEPAKVEPLVVYSREELEAIADRAGITGLREIAADFGVKNTSIRGLIEEILKAQDVK